ncbi:hypothetical protein FD754_015656, partial [Muntiacus muntjak]
VLGLSPSKALPTSHVVPFRNDTLITLYLLHPAGISPNYNCVYPVTRSAQYRTQRHHCFGPSSKMLLILLSVALLALSSAQDPVSDKNKVGESSSEEFVSTVLDGTNSDSNSDKDFPKPPPGGPPSGGPGGPPPGPPSNDGNEDEAPPPVPPPPGPPPPGTPPPGPPPPEPPASGPPPPEEQPEQSQDEYAPSK